MRTEVIYFPSIVFKQFQVPADLKLFFLALGFNMFFFFK